MYGYEEHFDITPEHILQKVTQKQIFEMVLGEEVHIGARYRSPLRRDKTPNCRFYEYGDTLLFVDFGDKVKHRSCFRFIMDYFGVKLTPAMKIICGYFKLSTHLADYKYIEPEQYKEELGSPASSIITFDKRDFERRDKMFWSQYLISESDLMEDKVHPLARYGIFKRRNMKTIRPYTLSYAIEVGIKVKIYTPFGDPKYKWITNCNENDIGNVSNLPLRGNQLIIKKSYKDHRVVRNLMDIDSVIWLQNEGCVPEEPIMRNLMNRFEEGLFFFDNDKPGVEAAEKLVAISNSYKPGWARAIHLPFSCPKDPGELVKKEGRRDTVEVLKQIGINGKNP